MVNTSNIISVSTSSTNWMRRLSHVAIGLLFCGTSSAFAWGLGQVGVQSSLGQPIRAQVKLIGADSVDAQSGCFKASLHAMDGGVIAPVKAKVISDGNTATVLLTSSRAINEPAFMLELAYECAPQIRREYAMLLDPPSVDSAPVVASTRSRSVASDDAYASGANDVAPVAEPKKKTRRATAPLVNDAGESQLMPQTGVEPQVVKPRAEKKPTEKNPKADKPSKNVLRLGGDDLISVNANGEMRLALSYSLNNAPVDSTATPASNAQADAATPEAAIASADAQLALLQQKISQLEAKTDQLRRLNNEQQAALDFAHQKEAKSDTWMLLYYVLFALVVLAIGWLLWRMRQLRSELVQSSWHQIVPNDDGREQKAHGLDDDVDGFQPTAPLQSSSIKPVFAAASAAEPIAPPVDKSVPLKFDDSHDHDYIFPGRVQSDLTSAEEVLDEIQQAEFWMYMNQPQRAIEILEAKEHPSSPLPWLYLFDLYRAVDDHERYDALATRFKAVFNCRVTPWEENHAEHSRGLEDFPVMQRIIELWPTAELVPFLETLLVDDRDGVRQGFDLAAYRDLLFLTNMAYRIQPAKALI